jgi:hypothetical protein
VLVSTAGPALPPELEPLAFLIGAWAGEGGGTYPTIEPFRYSERLTFGTIGKPFLAYTQRTVNLATGVPSHAETGYWRTPAVGRVELVLAHPTGIAEIAEGQVDGTRIELASVACAGTGTAKSVTGLERTYEVNGDVLRYTVRMAAVGQPMQHHLAGELRRVPPEGA